jgi:hypothetical protein
VRRSDCKLSCGLLVLNARRLPCGRCEQINARYPDMDAKAILTKLLGADVHRDEAGGSADKSGAVTGEQGGKMLACFLVRCTADPENVPSFLDDGSKVWLEKQLPKCALYSRRRRSVWRRQSNSCRRSRPAWPRRRHHAARRSTSATMTSIRSVGTEPREFRISPPASDDVTTPRSAMSNLQ